MNKCSGKMLVVDDEELVIRVCRNTLEGIGISVACARNAHEAWDLLNQGEYDCVLTDISMPGSMDGAALTEEVKGRFPSTDMLIMTGNPSLGSAVSTLKRGALDYLTKPFDPATLEAAVRRCFERRRLCGELNREKILRQELEAAYAELQKVERSKDAFISILNHELRTPLTIAITAAEMLESCKEPRQTQGIMQVLRSSLARENEVVQDLLLFSSLTAKHLQLSLCEVHPRELIAALVENYRSLWEPKQLSLEVSLAAASPPFWGDPALLQTAFKHLLLNAIHFNTKGGRVRIEAKSTEKSLEVLFADTGLGIAPEQQHQVFDRFYQVAEHMTRRVGGLGLGLAIVRRIVEAHGGVVTVASPAGGGSEFSVRLPRREPAPRIADKTPGTPTLLWRTGPDMSRLPG